MKYDIEVVISDESGNKILADIRINSAGVINMTDKPTYTPEHLIAALEGIKKVKDVLRKNNNE
jgi:hypothetical protein